MSSPQDRLKKQRHRFKILEIRVTLVIPNRALATVALALFVIFRPPQKYNHVPAVLKMYLYRHLYRNKNYSNVRPKAKMSRPNIAFVFVPLAALAVNKSNRKNKVSI
jgi:hypothetical protein